MPKSLPLPDLSAPQADGDPLLVEFEIERAECDRLWRMILAMAVRDGASSVHYHPWRTDWVLSYIVSQTRYGLVPFPPEMGRWMAATAGRLVCGSWLGSVSRRWFGWPFRTSGRVRLTGSFGSLDWAGVVWSAGRQFGVEWYRLDTPPHHDRLAADPEKVTPVPFDLQPTLVGELVELRPLRAEDFDALFAVASDPLIWEQHPAWDRYKPDVFAALFRESMESGGALVALDRATGVVIGSSRYYAFDEANSEIEIGWSFLARSHWGGKYNGEMKRLMLDHAFRFVKSVVFLIGPDNIRSQMAIQRIGAVRDGSRVNPYGLESFLFRIDATSFR